VTATPTAPCTPSPPSAWPATSAPASSSPPNARRDAATPEIHRILKRAIAREIYKHLCQPNSAASIDDLRRTRRDKNLPLRKVVEALGTSQVHVSRIERGLTHDRGFTDRYRTWLNAA
jgi:hypothetical protein